MFTTILSFFEQDYVATVSLCLLACLSVAIVMRFFVKQCLRTADEYFSKKAEQDSKAVVIFNTVKSCVYTLTACTLTAIALGMLMKVCKFPCENSLSLVPFYYVPMLAVQWFLDKHMKKLACSLFKIDCEADPETDEEPAPAKPKKVKVHYKKVAYTLDEDGNEVLVEK